MNNLKPFLFKATQYIFPLLFFIALAAVYPLQWLRIVYPVPCYEVLQLFTKATLAMTALAFCCFNVDRLFSFLRSKKHFFIFVLCLLSIYHLLVIPTYNIESFFAESVWWAIPLFAAVYHREMIRFLPWGFLFIWFFNFGVTYREIVEKHLFRGLPGNWNWHSCLMFMIVPVITAAIWSHNNRLRQILAALIVIWSIVLLFLSEFSTGASISLIASLVIILLALTRKKLPNWVVPACFSAIAGGVIIFLCLFYSNMINLPTGGIRGCLWRAGFSLIADSPVTGVGTGAFANTYKLHIPPDYYLMNFAAPHHDHPHNNFIYIWSCFGFIGIIAWIGMLAVPVFRELKRCCRHPHWLVVTLLFGLLVVLFHSMVDLTMFVWPTNIFGLLILGVFLGRLSHGRTPRLPIQLKVSFSAIAVFILVFTFFLLEREFRSSAACRNGRVYLDMQRPGDAYASFIRSMRFRPNIESSYRLARISFYDYKKPDLALKYLGLLPGLGGDNYLHYNEMVGKIFFMKREFTQARIYFIREVRNYPLSVRGWYYLMLTEQQLKDVQGVLKAREMLDLVLKQKNLTPEFIPLLLTNEYWDLNPRMIPQNVLDKYNIKRP